LQQLLGQQAALPDLFTNELALQPCATVDEQLYNLAKRQAELSGEEINWLGTYEHAAIHLEKQVTIQRSCASNRQESIHTDRKKHG
jgi:hypothetical protein